MRRNVLSWLLLLPSVGLLWIWIPPPHCETYQGLTSAHWEAEISRWEVVAQFDMAKYGRSRFWGRKQSKLTIWLEKIGFTVPHEPWDDMPLLKGDTTAIPVLIELLASRNSQARLLAAEGLERIGEKAKPAVPALLCAIDDNDENVRRQAEQTLWWIDSEAAGRVGVTWTWRGPTRARR